MKEIMIYNEIKQCTDEEFETISKFFKIQEKEIIVENDSPSNDENVIRLYVDHVFRDVAEAKRFLEEGGPHLPTYTRYLKSELEEDLSHSPKSDILSVGLTSDNRETFFSGGDLYVYKVDMSLESPRHRKSMKGYMRLIRELDIRHRAEVKKKVLAPYMKNPKK